MRPLETARLILRPLTLDDAPAIQRLFPQWEIVRLLASHVPWPYPKDGAQGYIRDVVLPAMASGDEWHWSLRLKSRPEELIGAIAVMRSENDNRGFWIGLDWQRQGLMTEASDRVTDFWFDELTMPVMRVPKAIGNLGSRRISEQNGMRIVAIEDRDFVSGRLPAEIWEITAAEWKARRRSP